MTVFGIGPGCPDRDQVAAGGPSSSSGSGVAWRATCTPMAAASSSAGSSGWLTVPSGRTVEPAWGEEDVGAGGECFGTYGLGQW